VSVEMDEGIRSRRHRGLRRLLHHLPGVLASERTYVSTAGGRSPGAARHILTGPPRPPGGGREGTPAGAGPSVGRHGSEEGRGTPSAGAACRT
jgi:hypothetical protein